jgi:naphthoate synthase
MTEMTGRMATDIRYETDDGVAIITINRPDRMNSFRGRTVDELIAAFRAADPAPPWLRWS